jgi:hypothetical protein
MMMEATKDMPECYYVPGEYFEKFAELIVRECLDVMSVTAEKERCTYMGDDVPTFVHQINIKQHFGVEE